MSSAAWRHVLEELQRIGLHGFTEGELVREKSNLLRSEESAFKQRDQVPSQRFVDRYVDHFLSGRPAPGIEAEWALYQELLPQISLVDFDEVADSWNRQEDTALLVVRPAQPDSSSDRRANGSNPGATGAGQRPDGGTVRGPPGRPPADERNSRSWKHR